MIGKKESKEMQLFRKWMSDPEKKMYGDFLAYKYRSKEGEVMDEPFCFSYLYSAFRAGMEAILVDEDCSKDYEEDGELCHCAVKDKIILTLYRNHCWCVGKVEHYKNSSLIKTYKINKFYDVNQEFIFIYDDVGSSGTGYGKGKLLYKISLEGAEFQTKIFSDESEEEKVLKKIEEDWRKTIDEECSLKTDPDLVGNPRHSVFKPEK